tara:strand:- start:10945 stop:11832 length:888 start_codon:yes stop_codon:yes gene_type:complete
MKGIILAGGLGTRLYPLTKITTKQLLPVYDKPMIYYSLSTLMLSGIRDVLIISRPEHKSLFQNLFKDGSHLGLNISYEIQPDANGIAECFIIGEEFIGEDDVCLILGDNIFYGNELIDLLQDAVAETTEHNNAVIFGYYVSDPEKYGIVEYDEDKNVLSIEEKPENPRSNCAAVGLYYYNNDVVEIAKSIKPSERGELEITTINEEYLKKNRLKLEIMGRGYAWFDAGSHDSLLDASQFVQTVESRQGLKIACVEEIAYRMGYISQMELIELTINLGKTNYSDYLFRLAKGELIE